MHDINQLLAENAELKERLKKGHAMYNQLKKDYDNLLKKPKLKPNGQALEIYESYPRKVGKPSALSAIQKAIAKAGFDLILEKTQDYALTIKRYGIDSKHEKWATVPHPSTWYNQERWLCDEAEWSAQFRDGKYVKPNVVVDNTPTEPQDWRERVIRAYPQSRVHDMNWRYFCLNYKDIYREIF
jgi:hypothetical protein